MAAGKEVVTTIEFTDTDNRSSIHVGDPGHWKNSINAFYGVEQGRPVGPPSITYNDTTVNIPLVLAQSSDFAEAPAWLVAGTGDTRAQRQTLVGYEPLRSTVSSSTTATPFYYQNPWWPTQPISSAVPFNTPLMNNNGLGVTSTGHVVTAGYSTTVGNLIISVLDEKGNIILAPRNFPTVTGNNPLLAYVVYVTVHSPTVVRVWYYNVSGFPTVNLVSRTVTIAADGKSATVGGESLSYQPKNGVFAATSRGTANVYTACTDDTLLTTVRVRSINALTNALNWTATFTGVPSTPFYYSMDTVDIAGTVYVVVAWHILSGGGSTYVAVINGSTGAVVNGPTTISAGLIGTIAVGAGTWNGVARIVLAITDSRVAPSVGPGTVYIVRDVLTVAIIQDMTRFWQRTISAPGKVILPNGDERPVFPVTRFYGGNAVLPTFDRTVYDSSIEFVWPWIYNETGNGTWNISPIMTLSHRNNPSSNDPSVLTVQGSSVAVSGSILHYVYPTYNNNAVSKERQKLSELAIGNRLVKVQLAPGMTSNTSPVSVTYDRGTAIVGGGMPVVWDGTEVHNVNYLHSPWISGSTNLNGVGGEVFPPGTYSFIATYEKVDNNGLLYRSTPSLPVSLTTTTGTGSIDIWVAENDGYWDDKTQSRPICNIFNTELNGATYYQVGSSSIVSRTGGYQRIRITQRGGIGSPVLYSDGSAAAELVAEAPPALWDVCSVSGRLWGIDAENRTRAVYTKPIVPGIAAEWNGYNELSVDSAAGRIIAVREVGGNPTFFCEYGIYAVQGDGPDAFGVGSFTQPIKISDVHVNPLCKSHIVTTPAGVIFETMWGYAVCRHSYAIEDLPQYAPTGIRFGGLHVSARKEVWLFRGRADLSLPEFAPPGYKVPDNLVWNYASNTFTRYFEIQNHLLLADTFNFVSGSGADATQGILALSEAASYIGTNVLSSSAGSGLFTVQQTRWWSPEAKEGSCNFQEVWVEGIMTQPVTLEMYQYADYSDVPVGAASVWSAAEAAQQCVTTSGSWAVFRAKIKKSDARSLRFSMIYQSPGSVAFIPKQMTLFYVTDGALKRRSVGLIK